MAKISVFCSVCGTRVSDPIARQYGTCPTCGSSLKSPPCPAPESVPGSRAQMPQTSLPHKIFRKFVVGAISTMLLLCLAAAGIWVYAYVNRWESGVVHPQNPNLVSSCSRGVWVSIRPGYEWVAGTALDRWQSGVHHPDNSRLVSCDEEGKWRSTEAGYVWIGGSKTEWRKGLPHGTFPHWRSTENEGSWAPDPGYVEKDTSIKYKYVSELVWKSGQMHPDHPHWVSSEQEGFWWPGAGYVKVYPDIEDVKDSRAWIVKWVAGVEHPEHPNVVSSKKEGVFVPAPGYEWIDKKNWQARREETQTMPDEELNSLLAMVQELMNINPRQRDWRRIEEDCDRLLEVCEKLKPRCNTPELRQAISMATNMVLNFKRQAAAMRRLGM